MLFPQELADQLLAKMAMEGKTADPLHTQAVYDGKAVLYRAESGPTCLSASKNRFIPYDNVENRVFVAFCSR